MRALFGPEPSGEQDQHSKQLQTPYKHEHRQHPFTGGRYDVETATISRHAGTEARVADAGEGREEGIDQRQSGCRQDNAADHYYYHIDTEECDHFRHYVRRYNLMIDSDGGDCVGVDTPV